MDIAKILNVYDSMFGKTSLEEIEGYLVGQMEEAKRQSEWSVLFTLLNEVIGFCRDTTQKEKALNYCEELQKLLQFLKLEGRVDYATALLNIANAYRAFGLFEESIDLYEQVLCIYLQNIPENDFSYASLYNNWSLVYQEVMEYEKAAEYLKKALAVVDTYEEAVIPQATTRVNLAVSLLQIGTEDAYREAAEYLQIALQVFERDGGTDFHYGAALVAMGDAYSYKKEYLLAADYYKKGMLEIEKHVGRTDNYYRVLEKLDHARALSGDAGISNLEMSRRFYETYGKEMIHNKFADYEDKIAVGVVGEGSDAYGFDDEISKDHDCEPGFCMWLTQKDYDMIGKALQQEYEKLVQHEGFLKNRRGVKTINVFYGELLGLNKDFENERFDEFDRAEEYRFASAVNGTVFRDDKGVFSMVRNQLLSYYPDEIWRKKLAQALHEFAQYGQSNYTRMMARNDVVTAEICVAKAMESAMDIMYLLNRAYAPYYKWKKKGLERFEGASQVLALLEKLTTTSDEKVQLIEEIAAELVMEMRKQNLVGGKELFLERYVKQILEGKNMDIIDKIVEMEWKQFDKVKNEGGRADCQDNFATFSIMRKSQYMTWNEELLESYLGDLQAAEEKGWNLIMEKYARMMKSTCPEKYKELEKDLPAISKDREKIQEEIVKIQVEWMEEFAKSYPKLSRNMRSIRTSTDNEFNTSYETYLRGELGTYSEKTFIQYTGFVISLLKEGKNLALETMKNTAKLYGYDSLDVVEGI